MRSGRGLVDWGLRLEVWGAGPGAQEGLPPPCVPPAESRFCGTNLFRCAPSRAGEGGRSRKFAGWSQGEFMARHYRGARLPKRSARGEQKPAEGSETT